VSETVLDASAVLAYLLGEPGEGEVGEVLEHGHGVISAVNLSEVAAKLADGGMSQAEIDAVVAALDMRVVPFDAGQALACARLRGSTRSLGLSLGDRACLALAEQLSLSVITTDRAWSALTVAVPIRVLRE
jgi:PIN domain nuclease of toxin-antitoxin system